MGNLKSRLHLHKKGDDHSKRDNDDGATFQNTNPSRTQIDQAIMSGPNRARVAETTSSEGGSTPVRGQAADTAQPTSVTRART